MAKNYQSGFHEEGPITSFIDRISDVYNSTLSKGDARVEEWPLMQSPLPCAIILVAYFIFLHVGPKMMENQKPFELKPVLVLYNAALVLLSLYMCYEFRMSSLLAKYNYMCDPVDYSNNPLALRMASVCWWYFFSKIIELLDTVFFVLRKKNNQVTFLHVYHHSTMIVNWWLGVKYIAGGQSFFLAMFNCSVHVIMYTYYALSALGPHMQKYLTWKKYLTQIQLVQFFLVLFHTGFNIFVECSFPKGFNYAVFLYAISMVLLFGNFYSKSYRKKEKTEKAKL
ncbi:elongation of very long chain fatty acids protein 4 [Strongylocentrotus purpuratus]|uniref:Elongation of very long chain fatty acids protein n=1 Tax=Strongylocentrotus purpuratus TaxID=7668 RepID=A0A7M7THF9_STRPU|nr:elongation of very long chain fatty acids protein 4 [Strongylocentrotus purpuratus]